MPRRAVSEVDNGKSEAVKALAGKWGGSSPTSGDVKFDWSVVDGHTLFTLVHVVTRLRGAIMLGVDRQGFGGTLAIWMGGERVFNKWYRPDETGQSALYADIDEFMADLNTLK